MDLGEVLLRYGTGQKWQWTTSPEFVLDDDGSDRAHLEPVAEVLDWHWTDQNGWWTCDPRTEPGDLAVVYRSQKSKDLRYVVLCTSAPFSLADDAGAQRAGLNEKMGCRCVVVSKIEPSIAIQELRDDPIVARWPALRNDFVRGAAPVPDDVWDRLMEMSTGHRPPRPKPVPPAGTIARKQLEHDLETWLADNLDALRPLGFEVELVRRQFLCDPGHDGTIDLLCQPRGKAKQRVAIELKAVEVDRDAVAQTLGYLGWLDQQTGVGSASGIVIGVGAHRQVEYVLDRVCDDQLHILNWAQLPLPPELAERLPMAND